jgi:hypothetical protein
VGELALLDASSNYFLATGIVNMVVNITAGPTANGLDTGAYAPGNWYYFYVISDGTNLAGLISLSATAPTLPGIFKYWGLVGMAYFTATDAFWPFRVVNRRVFIEEYNITGLTPPAAWASFPTGLTQIPPAIPPMATVAYGNSTATLFVAGDNLGLFGDINVAGNFAVPLTAPQTLYCKGTGAANRLSFTGYEF